MYCTCAQFLNRRNKKRSNSRCNSTRTLEFKNTFINAFPCSSPCYKYRHTNTIIPYCIKPPTSPSKYIKGPPYFFCYKSKWTSIHKYHSYSLAQKDSKKRLVRNPNGKYMSSYSSPCSRRILNTSPPKITSPTNSSITLQVSSKNRKHRKNYLWHYYRKGNPRDSQSFFFSIWSPKEKKKQYSKTISTCSESYCYQKKVPKCRNTSSSSSLRYLQNCIFTIVPRHKRPTLKTQRTQQKYSPSQWERSMSSSRSTYILYISPSMNNYTSSQKQLSFKTSMGYLMIYS
jgi:hypothetical protein